jgi:hypothetical protein
MPPYFRFTTIMALHVRATQHKAFSVLAHSLSARYACVICESGCVVQHLRSSPHHKVSPGYKPPLTAVTLPPEQVFLSEGVDVAVLEVGIGGRFDATNIVPRPVVCAVSALALEHTALLGNTLPQIAYHKGGIIKARCRGPCLSICLADCVCVCVCVCVYVCVCMHVCMYVCAYVFMYVCMCLCMYVCMDVCMYVCMYVYIYVCACFSISVCTSVLFSLSLPL